ncbi:hypothetical protein KSP40_PGU007398 [Platanthera guangdongensis]|uniref:Bulb-type lectin domain-containing protein n=1 Tax=Platanthera guangdongensis TaxID=2320717 RepID=A0ABR2MH13_9ASPA
MMITISTFTQIVFVVIIEIGMLADSTSLPSTLHSGQTLTTNNSLQAGNLFLTVQSDCNLVAYSNGRPNKVANWATNTNDHGKNCVLLLLQNCNLIVLSDTLRIVWSTKKTSKNGPCDLYLREDAFYIVDSKNILVAKQTLP